MEEARETHTPKKHSWFERHPKMTLGVLLCCFFLTVDRFAGFLLIPKNYDAFRMPHPFYHHDLHPNVATMAKWGDVEYPLLTNSLGFRDDQVKTIPRSSNTRRMLLIGDSFLEGLALLYEHSVGGILQRKLKQSGLEVLNAAVVSYSPKLYYLKIRYLLQYQKLKFDQLVVFIDISDIQNEIAYELFEPAPFPWIAELRYNLKRYLEQTSFFYFALFKRGRQAAELYAQLQADGLFPCLATLDRELLRNEQFRKAEGIWTIDPTIYEQFGKNGLALARQNMQLLVELCRQQDIQVTLVVYPWPAQIFQRDLESIQATFWQQFAQDYQVDFINLFPVFINESPAQDIYNKYFIYGDVHWNAAGHMLVANRVLPQLTPQ